MARKLFFLSAVLLLGIFALGLSGEFSLDLTQAKALWENKDYAGAKQAYLDIIAANPGSDSALEAQKNLALVHIDSGDEYQAETIADDLIAEFGTISDISAEVYELAFTFHNRVNNYGKSRQLYQYVLDNGAAEEKHTIWSLSGVASSNLKYGFESDAEAAIEQLTNQYSGHAEVAVALYDVAIHYHRSGNYEKARQVYKHVLDHGDVDNYYKIFATNGMNLCDIAMKNDSAADAGIQTLIDNFSNNPDIVALLQTVARDLLKTGRYGKATELNQYILDTWPNDEEHAMAAKGGLVVSNAALGNDLNADDAIDDLIAQYSDSTNLAETLFNAAEKSLELGKEARALELYQYIINDPGSDTSYILMSQSGVARCKIALGDDVGAAGVVQTLKNVPVGNGNAVKALRQIADTYSEFSKTTEAKNLYQYILDNSPESQDVMLARIGSTIVKVKSGDDAGVLADVNSLIANFPEHDYVVEGIFLVGDEYRDLAYEKQQQGQEAKANELFAKAITVWEEIIYEIPASTFDPNSYKISGENRLHGERAYRFAAHCYSQLGNYQKAVEYYEYLVENWPKSEGITNTHLLIGRCYEQLKSQGVINASQADQKIIQAYTKIVTDSPNSRTAKIAKRKLARLNK